MAFSATESAFEGFRLAKRSPMTILVWAVFYIVVTALVIAVAGGAMGQFMQMAATMEPGAEPSDAEMMAFMSAYFSMLGLILPISLVLGSVSYAAVNRAVVRPSESAFGYLRLGMDEVRVFVVSLVLSIVFGLGFGLAGGLIFGVMGAMAAMMSDNAGLVGLLMVVAGLLFVALIIWVVVRLSLALPITVAERRIAIFDSWKLTKGHFWGLLGMAILAWVLCLVVQILLSIVLMPILFAVSGGFENLAAIETMQPMEILQTMAPMAITILVFAAIVSALQLAIMYAPFASAYMGLTGRGGDAPEPAVSTEL